MSARSGISQERGNVKDERNLKRNQYGIISMNVNVGSKKKNHTPESTPNADGFKQVKKNGEAKESTPTVRDRIQVIKKVVDDEKPHLVLFQEFTFTKKRFRGEAWEDSPFDKKYMFCGEGETGLMIMYDKNEFEVQSINADEISKRMSIYEISKRMSEISKRMSICKIKSSQLADVEFICVTWHGKWKCSSELKSKDLENLLEFLKNVCREQKRPLLIGGDFNLKFENVESIVKDLNSNFKVPSYVATERRENNVIDMFITMDIDLDSVEAINIQGNNSYVDEETNEQRDVLDHDPISGVLCVKPNTLTYLYHITMTVKENQRQMMSRMEKLELEVTKTLEKLAKKLDKIDKLSQTDEMVTENQTQSMAELEERMENLGSITT